MSKSVILALALQVSTVLGGFLSVTQEFDDNLNRKEFLTARPAMGVKHDFVKKHKQGVNLSHKQEVNLSHKQEVNFSQKQEVNDKLKRRQQFDQELLLATQLPKVTKVMNRPNKAVDSMYSQISSLLNNLDTMRKDHFATLVQQRKDYFARLEVQRAGNLATAAEVKMLAQRIDSLNKSNVELRSKANALRNANGELGVQLQFFQGNITTAEEFADLALNSSDQLLVEAPELEVLKELSHKELEEMKARMHEDSLDEVSRAPSVSLSQTVSLLQTAAQHNMQSPEETLESVNILMNDLKIEQNESLRFLQAKFEEEWQEGQSQNLTLLEESAALNGTLNTALELEQRLITAVSHLDLMHQELVEKKDHIQGFMERVGAEAWPAKKHA